MTQMRRCENPYRDSLKGTVLECKGRKATTWRKESDGLFGPVRRLAVCAECASLIDEGRAEAAWEARVS